MAALSLQLRFAIWTSMVYYLTPMKITRNGLSRNSGIATVVDSIIEHSKTVANRLIWSRGSRNLTFRMIGSAGNSTYAYNVSLSGEEIAVMLECALIGASDDVAVHAQAKAMGAYVREIASTAHQQK